MRYYEVTKQEGRYKVMIYKILFSFLFPVFTGYTDNTQAVNEMLMYYSKRTGTVLNTVYSYKAGRKLHR